MALGNRGFMGWPGGYDGRRPTVSQLATNLSIRALTVAEFPEPCARIEGMIAAERTLGFTYACVRLGDVYTWYWFTFSTP